MSEILFSKPQSSLSSGFIGTIICWCFGLLLTVLAVAIAVNGDLAARLTGMAVLAAGASVCGWARSAGIVWKLRLSAILLAGTMLLLISEIALRKLSDFPHDRPALMPHPSLGFVLDSTSAQIDEQGFRNSAIPETVDVVTIGDGQTAGLTVPAESTWPAIFGANTNQSVYNMAVPGYGPDQYQQLIQQALAMKPRQVIVGLNFGSDLADPAFTAVPVASSGSLRRKLRRYTAVGSFCEEQLRQRLNPSALAFDISHATNPVSISQRNVAARTAAMDMEAKATQQRLQHLVTTLKAASDQCRQSGAALTVMLLPTPEFVCGRSVDASTLPPAVQTMLDAEGQVRDQLLAATSAAGVFVIDAFPSMVRAASETPGVFEKSEPQEPTVARCEALAAALSQSGSAATN